MKKFLKFILISLLIVIGIYAYASLNTNEEIEPEVIPEQTVAIDENGRYTSKEDVALYLHTYGHLPSNYITKSEAKKMGWVASKKNLHIVCEGCSIGGDIFTNSQKILPTKKGRIYYECDIDYVSGIRNAKRIVFSNDGLIFYTGNHYNSFEQLYGDKQ